MPQNLDFEFSDEPKDRNGSRMFIEVGESAEQTMKIYCHQWNLKTRIFFSKSDSSFEATPVKLFPSAQPKIFTSSKKIVVKRNLDDAWLPIMLKIKRSSIC